MQTTPPITHQYDPMIGPASKRGLFGKALDWLLDRIIYTPPKPPTKLDKKTVKWITPSKIPGSKIPISIHTPSKRKRKPSTQVGIFSYGNNGDLGAVQPLLQKLADKLHITVIGYDYIGYGFSTFKSGEKYPSTIGIEQAIMAVYQHVITERKCKPEQIILMGHSMGTAASLACARKVKVGGTVLISSFKSILEAHPYTNWKWLAPDDFMLNVQMITETVDQSPVFLIHGKKDETIPIENSYALAKEIENTPRYYPPFWVDGMGHNNIIEDKGLKLLQPKITQFLQKLVKEHQLKFN